MRRFTLLAATALVPGSLLMPSGGHAAPRPAVRVAAAYDLFQTDAGGTHYGPVHFRGVKGCKQFPAAVNTDTIVQRLRTATPANPYTPIEAKCLQLRGDFLDLDNSSPIFEAVPGTDLVDVGPVTLPVKAIYVTLQTDRGRHPGDAGIDARSPAKVSRGNLHFSFGRSGCGGTFDSDLEVHFDVRAWSIDGPIVYSTDDNSAPFFHSDDTPWGCSAGPGDGGFVDKAQSICVESICVVSDEHRVGAPADLLPGVNHRMNGRDSASDFFPMEVFA